MIQTNLLTLNSASNLSSCFALYACLGFRSNPGFLDLRPTVFGAVKYKYIGISVLYILFGLVKH